MKYRYYSENHLSDRKPMVSMRILAACCFSMPIDEQRRELLRAEIILAILWFYFNLMSGINLIFSYFYTGIFCISRYVMTMVDPGQQHVGYGFTCPDNDVILSYDAMSIIVGQVFEITSPCF